MARELRRHDMVGSMGRVGAAGDNAAMESFWSLLQTNVLNQQRWATRHELRLAIVVWIERKYHRQRAQDTLGGRGASCQYARVVGSVPHVGMPAW